MYIEKVEHILKDHEKNKKYKRMLEIELECIGETGISAVNYSREKISETNKVNRSTEKIALRNISKEQSEEEEREDLRKEIKALDSLIRIIEISLTMLEEVERKIIEKFYFEEKAYNVIEREIYLTHRQIKYKKKNALNKIREILETLEERNQKVS